jgi:hypothetical protein
VRGCAVLVTCAEFAARLYWALLASRQIAMRSVDGWQRLAEKPDDKIIDRAPLCDSLMPPEDASANYNTSREGTKLTRSLEKFQFSP